MMLVCNELASAAGINSADGQGYVAMMSDDTSSFLDRLRPATRGWVRMDGRPLFDSFDEVLEEQRLLFPPHLDELAVTTYTRSFTRSLWTGATFDISLGLISAGRNGSNWTDANAPPPPHWARQPRAFHLVGDRGQRHLNELEPDPVPGQNEQQRADLSGRSG